MNTKRFLIVLFAATLFSFSCAAATESHRAAIEKLFTVLKVDKQYEASMLAGFEAGTGLNAERMAALPEAERNKVKAGLDKVKAKMLELMGWEKVKSDMIDVYAKNFTEAEAKDIVQLMDSPAGQMYVTKQLAMIPESQAVAAKKAQAMMPQLMEIMQDAMK